MMNREERIIKYLDKDMSNEEKLEFEKELEKSEELRNEFNLFSRVKNETEVVKNIKADNRYLNSIIPHFQSRLEKPSKNNIFKNLSYALPVLILIIISYIVFQPFSKNSSSYNSIEEFTNELSGSEKNELLDYLVENSGTTSYSDLDVTEEDLTLDNSVEGNTELLQVASAYDIDISDLAGAISEKEAEDIYNEMLNKKFFNEANL